MQTVLTLDNSLLESLRDHVPQDTANHHSIGSNPTLKASKIRYILALYFLSLGKVFFKRIMKYQQKIEKKGKIAQSAISTFVPEEVFFPFKTGPVERYSESTVVINVFQNQNF